MYEVGQVVCLWQEDVDLESERVVVLKEVLVTITETKIGAPGEFSRKPVSSMSLRGTGDDGKDYEKHWECWPESQTSSFDSQWSMRDDGEGGDSLWIPKEAVHAHSALQRENQRHGKQFVRVDVAGAKVLPKGDVVYCDNHGEYYYPSAKCLSCLMEEMRKASA